MSLRIAVAFLTLLTVVGYQQVKPQTAGDGYKGLDIEKCKAIVIRWVVSCQWSVHNI